MSVQQELSVPTWDMAISHTLAFLKHEPAVVDYAMVVVVGRSELPLLCSPPSHSQLDLE